MDALSWSDQRSLVERADLTVLGMNGTHKLILLLFHGFAGNKGFVFPSHKTMAQRACINERTLRRAITDMKDAGVIEVDEYRREDGSRGTNRVTILFGKLEDCQPEDVKKTTSGHNARGMGLMPTPRGVLCPGGEGLMPTHESKEERPVSISQAAAPRAEAGEMSHKQWTERFTSEWRTAFRGDYPHAGPKDGAAMTRIIKALKNDYQKFCKVVRRYFADDDRFVIGNGHSISLLSTKLPVYVVDRPEPGEPPRRRLTVAEADIMLGEGFVP